MIGTAEAVKTLSGMTDRFYRRVMRKALSRATKQLVGAMRANIEKRSGLLGKSLGRKIKTYPLTGTIVAIIGPRRGYGGMAKLGNREVYEDPAKIAHFKELGTKAHAIGQGMHPGAAAKPFEKTAWEQNSAKVEADFSAACGEGLSELVG